MEMLSPRSRERRFSKEIAHSAGATCYVDTGTDNRVGWNDNVCVHRKGHLILDKFMDPTFCAYRSRIYRSRVFPTKKKTYRCISVQDR